MSKSARVGQLGAIVVLLLGITLWNRARGVQDAAFGLYYLPIIGAAWAFAAPGALAIAVLASAGAAWSTLFHNGEFSESSVLVRPDLWLDLPLFLVFAVLSASLTHRRATVDALAYADPLTGLLKRHYFIERLAEEVKRARADSQPIALLLINIDHFTRLNEQHGKERCDEALRALAAALRRAIRAVDVPGRTKGREFAVVLPETPPAGASLVAERIRKAVQDFGDLSGLHTTVSIGLLAIDLGETRETISYLAQADEALYEARRTGRNRVVAFDPEMHHGVR